MKLFPYQTLSLFLAISISLFACHNGKKMQLSAHKSSSDFGLKNYYSSYFPIGVAVSPEALQSDEKTLILQQFNSLTPENVMKMGIIHPKENVYNWRYADSIVAFAQRNHLKVRGHTLIWHQQMPDWLLVDSVGKPVTKPVLLERLKAHILAVVGRYKGKVYAWDVVNEAISDNPSEFYRPSKLWEIGGEEIFFKAFEWAHEADPNAILFYNDYNEINLAKRTKIIAFVNKLKHAKIPIHAVGLQAHWNVHSPTSAQLDATLNDFLVHDIKVQITELDISIFSKQTPVQPTNKTDSAFSAELAATQAAQYQMCFEKFRAFRKNISGVTFWNVSDRHSWLDNFPVKNRKDFPLLFDKNLHPKKAFQAVVTF